MRCEGAGNMREQPLLTHACHILDDLVGTQVITPGLIGAVGGIEDDDIESQPVSMKAWPGLLYLVKLSKLELPGCQKIIDMG
jgi:hypothetical protein